MRDVRRRERLAGLKRTSKRDDRIGPATKLLSTDAKENEPNETRLQRYNLPLRKVSQISAPSSRSSLPRGAADKDALGRVLPDPLLNPNGWHADPFCTLPGSSDMQVIVDTLLKHRKLRFRTLPINSPCVHVALPAYGNS
jgi:hypothetical protein